MSKQKLLFDEIGQWSEIKLEILKKYAKAYSTILSMQSGFSHYYIDGFAGAGVHLSKATGSWVQGSPLNALQVRPPFKHHFLIDLDGSRVRNLHALIGSRRDVSLFQGDSNKILLSKILPRISYRLRRRALCLLDPYGLQIRLGCDLHCGQDADDRSLSQLPHHGNQQDRALDRSSESPCRHGCNADSLLGRRDLAPSCVPSERSRQLLRERTQEADERRRCRCLSQSPARCRRIQERTGTHAHEE